MFKYIYFVLLLIPLNIYSKNINISECRNNVVLQKKSSSDDLDFSIKIGTSILQNCSSDSIKAVVLQTRGRAYLNKADYINGFKDGIEAKKIFNPKKHNLKDIVYNHILLSNIYKRIGLSDKAFQEIEEANQLINKQKPYNYYLSSSLKIVEANILFSLNKYDKAIPILNKAEQEAKLIIDPELLNEKNKLLSMIYSDLSNIYLGRKDYIKSEVYIKKALQILKSNKSFEIDYINIITLAEIYYETNRFEKVTEILAPISKNNNIEPIFNQHINELLSRTYKKLNDTHNEKIHQIKADSIQSKFQNNKMDGIKEAYKYIDNELKKNESENTSIKYISIAILLLILFSVYILIKKYTNRIKSQNDAYKALKLCIQEKNAKKEFRKNTDLSNTELLLLEKLQKFEEEKGFLKKNITLAVLAVDLETNTYYLSEIINKTKGKNINTYINDLRIRYIVEELYNKPELLSYKISYIAELAGFNSHNSFSTVFKKVTKISPSIFLEQLRKDKIHN